jgi:ATP-dependent helicase HrpB
MLLDSRCDQSILVFLPGVREILGAQQACVRRLGNAAIDIIPLMAELPPHKQKLAFDESRRRLILATNVAETSLTIPGITGVIDTGLAKIAGHAHWSGMPTLQLKDISQASAIQRAGRAGRVRPGVVYRLYDESSYLSRDAYTLPEIKRVDLADCALQIAAFRSNNLGDTEVFPWFEQPDQKLWDSAQTLLKNLGMLDADSHITEWGRRVNEVPLHPRQAAVFLKAVDAGMAEAGALVAALISEGFLLRSQSFATDRRNCDVTYQLEILQALKFGQGLSSVEVERSIDQRRVASVQRLARMLLARTDEGRTNFVMPAQADVAAWVLAGYSDRVAKLRLLDKKSQQKHRQPMYHFCLGRGGVLSEQSVLSGKEKFVIAVDAQENLQQFNAARSTVIRSACEISADYLRTYGPGFLLSHKQEQRMSPVSGNPENFDVTYYGNVVLAEEKAAAAGDVGQIILRMLRDWPWPFSDDLALRTHNAKSELLKKHNWSEQLTHFSGELFELMVHSLMEGRHTIEELLAVSMEELIAEQLSYAELEILRTVLPNRLKLINGKEILLNYDEHGCSASAHIQDFFGLDQGPSLLGGRCPIRLFLLAPNKRPAQVTTDLAGFWQAGYFEVRKELLRRYPRHHWPDTPEKSRPFLTKRQAAEQ